MHWSIFFLTGFDQRRWFAVEYDLRDQTVFDSLTFLHRGFVPTEDRQLCHHVGCRRWWHWDAMESLCGPRCFELRCPNQGYTAKIDRDVHETLLTMMCLERPYGPMD